MNILDPRADGENKFGRNFDVDTAGDEDVWNGGGLYPWPIANETLYISSSNDNDNQLISCKGLDANLLLVNGVEATLDGFTGVQLGETNNWWRTFRAFTDAATSPAGDVYIGTEANPTNGVPAPENIRAKINTGRNQTLMAIYTIPRGVKVNNDVKCAWLTAFKSGITRVDAAGSVGGAVDLRGREFGKVFRSLYSGLIHSYAPPLKYEPKRWVKLNPGTDIKLYVENVSTNNTDVFGSFELKFELKTGEIVDTP